MMKLTRNLVIGLATMLAWVDNLAASQEKTEAAGRSELAGVLKNTILNMPGRDPYPVLSTQGLRRVRMLKGRFLGSNAGNTSDFWTVAEIKETPPEGQWTEIQLTKPVRFRYIKYELPAGRMGQCGRSGVL